MSLIAALCEVAPAALTQRIQKIADPQRGADYSINIVEPDSGADDLQLQSRTSR